MPGNDHQIEVHYSRPEADSDIMFLGIDNLEYPSGIGIWMPPPCQAFLRKKIREGKARLVIDE